MAHARIRFTLLLAMLFVLQMYGAEAQTGVSAPEANVTAILLSDTHLDPLRDPGKAKRLAAAPASEWSQILAEPPAANAKDAFAALQETCGERGIDADNALLLSSFAAAAKSSEHPGLVLLDGDFLVHRIDCRYRHLLGAAEDDAAGLAAFEAKTIEYQLAELRRQFPATPIYAAIGNNDTGCEDYAMDADSPYLRSLAPLFERGWIRASKADLKQALADFGHFGSYSLPLPAPMRHSRVIVSNDVYLAANYRGTCAGKSNATTGRELVEWLGKELASARQKHENVWLVAHMPPEVNIYATYTQPHDICHGQPPATYLAGSALNQLIAEYSDVVRVFISGHTHLDESHLLQGAGTQSGLVPLKTIPSITPISNNPPSFLTASVDPQTATLTDYTLHLAPARSGSAVVSWSVAYDFRDAYGEKAFDAASLTDILERFRRNDPADEPAIATYEQHLASGLRLLAFQASYPQQVCAMRHSDPAAFSTCACAATSGLLPPAQEAK